jgi:hypothetical protein
VLLDDEHAVRKFSGGSYGVSPIGLAALCVVGMIGAAFGTSSQRCPSDTLSCGHDEHDAMSDDGMRTPGGSANLAVT